MRAPKLFFMIAGVVLSMILVVTATPTAAYADAQDEAAMSRVGNAIEDLWGFVDNTGSMPDDQFYAQFADRALSARDDILGAYKVLGQSSDTGEAKRDINKVQDDVGRMSDQLLQWRQAALNKDSDAFETVNSSLGDTVAGFNNDVNAYNAAQDGNRSTYTVGAYAAAISGAFLLTCVLFAWAYYRNDKSDDVAAELRRRLRWQGAYSAAAILVATIVPTAIYLWTTLVMSPWFWALLVPGVGGLLFTTGRYIKVLVLTRRQKAAA